MNATQTSFLWSCHLYTECFSKDRLFVFVWANHISWKNWGLVESWYFCARVVQGQDCRLPPQKPGRFSTSCGKQRTHDLLENSKVCLTICLRFTLTHRWQRATTQGDGLTIGSNTGFSVAQGHLDMWTGGAGARTTNPAFDLIRFFLLLLCHA